VTCSVVLLLQISCADSFCLRVMTVCGVFCLSVSTVVLVSFYSTYKAVKLLTYLKALRSSKVYGKHTKWYTLFFI
jgi:hypothetical protein